MAVKVKETKLMLKSVFTDESSGVMKRRTVSIKGIKPEATKENLYSLYPLVSGNFSTSSLITEEVLANEA